MPAAAVYSPADKVVGINTNGNAGAPELVPRSANSFTTIFVASAPPVTGTPGLKCPIIHNVRRAEG